MGKENVNQQAAAASSKKLAAQMEKAGQRAEEQVDARAEEQARRNEEAEARMSSSQPTPTQRENDLAKVGVVVDEKEDHGGEDEQESIQRVMQSKQGFEYNTREARPARSKPAKPAASKSKSKSRSRSPSKPAAPAADSE